MINSLGVTTQNLQSSESAIKDTDMASEMVELNKDQILLQAGTSMLAQANAGPADHPEAPAVTRHRPSPPEPVDKGRAPPADGQVGATLVTGRVERACDPPTLAGSHRRGDGRRGLHLGASSTSGTSSSNPASVLSISGLGTGLDDQQIINQLVAVEQQKVTTVQALGTVEANALGSWSTIRSALSNLTTAEQSLVQASDWQLLTGASSDESVATVAAGSGTMTGALSFTVNAIAQAGVVRSNNTIASLSDNVTSASSFLVAAGGGKLGFSSVASDANVALGSHTIEVTQSSAAAAKTGTTPLAASTVINGSDDTLQVVVNGTTYNLTLAAGTYNAASLAAAVQQALTADSAAATASVGANGALSLATTGQGSAATIRVTGGNALAALGLTVDATSLHGTDGIVTVDGGAAQTFGNTTPLLAGGTISMSAGTGNITATLAGGLQAGTMTGSVVSSGDGSLQSVVSAINNANAGVTAAAGPGGHERVPAADRREHPAARATTRASRQACSVRPRSADSPRCRRAPTRRSRSAADRAPTRSRQAPTAWPMSFPA